MNDPFKTQVMLGTENLIDYFISLILCDYFSYTYEFFQVAVTKFQKQIVQVFIGLGRWAVKLNHVMRLHFLEQL